MIELDPDTHRRLIASLKRYADEHLEVDMGDLKARLLLDYFLAEIGPSVYNQALEDARAYLTDRLADMENVCAEPEFGFWPTPPR